MAVATRPAAVHQPRTVRGGRRGARGLRRLPGCTTRRGDCCGRLRIHSKPTLWGEREKAEK